MTIVLAGLVVGLVGSGHCVAMCGPLVLLASPRNPGDQGTRPVLRHALAYHAGRATMYLALGIVAGLAGSAMARLGLGRALAVAAGVILLAQALTAAGILPAPWTTVPGADRVTAWVGAGVRWTRAHRVTGPLVLGVFNGLLPCGLLYAALTAAAGLGDTWQALAFMAGFATGTAPALVLVALAGRAIAARVPLVLRRAAPVALALVGVLLLSRGLMAPHAGHAPAPDAVSPSVHHHAH